MIILELSILFIWLAWGIAVGSGFVAFLAVLGVIPRLTQLTKTQMKLHMYEVAVVAGAIIGSWFSFHDLVLRAPVVLVIIVGLLSGTFNGMLAAALTEVLNVIPILAKRIGIDGKIIYLLMAIVFGKIAGSLFQWLYYIYF
ncbi:MAG: stage V sporulation protein AB [Bacillus sp. (in: firmicutes)]